MLHDAHEAYRESRILSADPVELIRILYRIAIDRVREAREHLARGDVAARSNSISGACEALVELACSLNHEEGGEVSRRLAALYEYMQWRLVEANLKQSEEPLAEVLALLTTLLEAWQQVKIRPAADAEAGAAGLLPLAAHTRALNPFGGEQAAEYAPQSWCG
jgi:flagellar protein FliS